MEIESAPPNLACDIPDEVILQIASALPAKDVLNLATTCRKLASILNSDDAWEFKVLDWIAEQDMRSGVLGSSAEKMRDLLGLQTLRSTYQALILLKAWPMGLWYSKEDHFQPDGMLLWVSHHNKSDSTSGNSDGVSFEFTFLAPSSNYTGLQFPWPRGMLKWAFYSRERERPDSFVCALVIKPAKGVVCSEIVDVFIEGKDSPYILQLNKQDKTQFQLFYYRSRHRPSDNAEPDGCWNWHRAGVLDVARAPYKQQQLELKDEKQPLVIEPGIYSALYGSHDREVVQIERTADATQYIAVKLKGDENVPATKISFKFDVNNALPGPYNSHRDDPHPNGAGPRPIICIGVAEDDYMPFAVDMEERPVGTVISNAQGQINRVPMFWNPEWVTATIVVYEYGGSGDGDQEEEGPFLHSVNRKLRNSDRAVFSVIFEDPGQRCRHVMDFYRVVLPRASY